jgi:hypothetical protein
MKKLVFSIFTFVICYNLQTQELELPNPSPQSPNAFQFTKYGEVNVNESTGTISPSIPLYSYNAGGVEIPIVLNYTGNAVKVAQSPTWVGINWNLTPGGVITRQVRDLPDEKIPLANKKFFSRLEVNDLEGYGETINGKNMWYSIQGTDWYNEMENIGNSTSSFDSEADVFNYNFLGYSGSFYLDEKLEPHLLNYNKELKIKFDRDLTSDSNKSTIYITTPQGDKYYFGGEDASESSRTYVSVGSGSTVGIKHAQNAFYLYKVEPYKGGHIDFTYTQVYTGGSFHGHVVDEYENLKKRKNLISNCGTTHTYSGKRNILEEIQSRVMLTKISSNLNSGSVDFSSSYLDDRMRKLQTVFVKKADGSNIKKFTFNYFTDTAEEKHASDKKFFLEQVNFHDKNDTIIYDYDLEYNNPDRLPSKFSMAKDLNGYFNDVKTNKTLLPNNDQFMNTMTLANRETNPISLQYGSLSKIIYPTGGYTNFSYECPIKGYTTEVDTNILNVYHRAVDRNDTNYYKHILSQDDLPFYLEASQMVNINFSVQTEGDLTSKNYIRLYAVEGFNGPEELINEFQIPGNGDDEPFFYNYSARFKVPTNNDRGYTFKLVLNAHSTLNDGNRISAFARIDIPNNTQVPDYFPSLRIKKISTFNPSSKEPIIKRFFYNNLTNRTLENSILVANFNHVNITTVGRSGEGDCSAGNPIPYLNLSTSALNNTYVDDSRKIIYPVVSVSYGGDNFEQGGKQSIFRVNVNRPNDIYFFEHENNGLLLNVEAPYGNILSFDNGKLLNEKIVSYNSSTEIFKILKESFYVYESRNMNTVHRINNIKASTVQTGATMANDMRKYNFSFYQLISKKNLLTTRTTKEYLDNLSEPIITSESYQYGTYVDRPSETKITNSNGIRKKVKYFYPDDVEGTGSLGHDNLSSTELYAIERLKKDGLHRLNQVQTETYILNGSSDEILSTSRTLFNIDASTVVLPEIIQTSKGDNPLKDRVKYNYYLNGNIKSVSKIDGTKIYYVWGYEQTQPIAKIENYTSLTEEQQTAINKAVTASNSDDDRCILITEKCNENSLRDKLVIVRAAFPNSMVTTYTYDPLIGVTSITDPREETIYYHYDSFNRLESVKDAQGYLLSKNKYNYKN